MSACMTRLWADACDGISARCGSLKPSEISYRKMYV